MVTVVVIVVVVEIAVMGVGAVVDDTVEVVVVELQPMPSNNSRTSLPVSAQATTRSRSPCVSNMSYTGAPAKGRLTLRFTRGLRLEKREAPCALHNCAETHMPRNICGTDSSGSGSVGCAVKCSGNGCASSSSPCCCLGLLTPLLALRLIFCDVLRHQMSAGVKLLEPPAAVLAASQLLRLRRKVEGSDVASC